jgi:hypothetical protein
MWQGLVNTYRYTVGTLRHYASIDSPREYELWKHKKSSSRINETLKGGHNDLAKMLHDLFASVFTCADPEKNLWFEFKNHRWKRMKKGIELRKKISDDLVTRFQEEARKIYGDLSEDADSDTMDKKLKTVNGIIKNLKSAPFKSNIMVECCLEGTMVNLANGLSTPIESLVKSDSAFGYDRARDGLIIDKVTAVIEKGKSECFELTLEDGSTINATSEHPFLTTGGWMLLQK